MILFEPGDKVTLIVGIPGPDTCDATVITDHGDTVELDVEGWDGVVRRETVPKGRMRPKGKQ